MSRGEPFPEFMPALIPAIILIAWLYVPFSLSAGEEGPNTIDPLQFSIDAVTHADDCLYMLQLTRDPENADCNALRDFEQRYRHWEPDLDGLEDNTRRRVVGNQHTYQQTQKDIERERQRLQ